MATEKPAAARLFQNKKTGVVWEVADPATLKRVLDDPQTYEEIKQQAEKKQEKPS
jgi:hypothetical protein